MADFVSLNQKASSNSLDDAIWSCLSHVRVLDITNELGFMCGKMLADMGADVIKVEQPTKKQSPSRNSLHRKTTDTEKKLYWFSYNAGKRCITLNLKSQPGRDILRKLVGKSDIVIESFPPDTMQKWGLDFEDLQKINSKIIFTSITPFGRNGPYKNYKISDVVALAMSGQLFLTGDADRPPVQTGFPQTYLHGGAEACVATLMALYHREITGEGQLIDVSIQEALLGTTFNAIYTWITKQVILQRMGPTRMVGRNLEMQLPWPCNDGFVSFSVLGGSSGGKTMRNLANWMEEEGMGNETISNTDWGSFDFYGLTTEMITKVSEPIKHFFSQYTKDELFEESIRREIMLFPVVNADSICKDPHLQAKGFWQKMKGPYQDLNIDFPKSPIRINDEYPYISRPSPLKGEHNIEVYKELLHFSDQELNNLRIRRVL